MTRRQRNALRSISATHPGAALHWMVDEAGETWIVEVSVNGAPISMAAWCALVATGLPMAGRASPEHSPICAKYGDPTGCYVCEPVCLCRQCGKLCEDERRCYAIPTCYACLPPPPPLPVFVPRVPCPTVAA